MIWYSMDTQMFYDSISNIILSPPTDEATDLPRAL